MEALLVTDRSFVLGHCVRSRRWGGDVEHAELFPYLHSPVAWARWVVVSVGCSQARSSDTHGLSKWKSVVLRRAGVDRNNQRRAGNPAAIDSSLVRTKKRGYY